MVITDMRGGEGDGGPPAKKKTIKFRNYNPKDEDLKTKKLENVKPIDVTEGKYNIIYH